MGNFFLTPPLEAHLESIDSSELQPAGSRCRLSGGTASYPQLMTHLLPTAGMPHQLTSVE